MATAQLTASTISARSLPSFEGFRPSAHKFSPSFENVRMVGLVNRSFRSLVVKAATVVTPKYTSVKPLGDIVLVKTKNAEEKTQGGILLPTAAQTKPQGGEVVAVGEAKTIGKTKVDICVKTGAQVVYSKYAGTELEFNGSKHLILKKDDIVGILETDDVKDLKPLNDRVLIKVVTCLDSIKWDDKGWAVAIAQNVDTGAILMQGFVNRDAVAMTISSRKATFYSRSRSTLWIKGETSNNFINVHDIFFDCDRDSIIYLGKPDGPTCHTGSETCYFTSVVDLQEQQTEEHKLALTTLYSLESTISQRKAELAMSQSEKPSWTKRLLLDSNLLCSKLREEADELCRTLEENEDKSRTASEMADVLYHAMVLLAMKDVKMEDVLEVLRKRFSQSGIEEKKSRASK